MPTARKHVILPGQPGFYHCVNRCVRRARLCGNDPVTGNNYDHRRDWMVERLRVLTTCFAIDIYAYAFMENHYHIVLYVDPKRVDTWSDDEVVKKWKTLWMWRRPSDELDIPEIVSREKIQQWRNRLADVSWVMRLLNEPMARIANAEDGAKGHFWESRFKCSPLLDDQGLVTCMVYADLNPIKAGIALTPEDSDYTSIQLRLKQIDPGNDGTSLDTKDFTHPQPMNQTSTRHCSLLPITSSDAAHAQPVFISLERYIELVRITTDAIINEREVQQTETLRLLGINATGWKTVVTDFMGKFRIAAGTDQAFSEFMRKTGRSRRGDAATRRLLFS